MDNVRGYQFEPVRAEEDSDGEKAAAALRTQEQVCNIDTTLIILAIKLQYDLFVVPARLCLFLVQSASVYKCYSTNRPVRTA